MREREEIEQKWIARKSTYRRRLFLCFMLFALLILYSLFTKTPLASDRATSDNRDVKEGINVILVMVLFQGEHKGRANHQCVIIRLYIFGNWTRTLHY